ncbi:MAG: hypothetical protein GDA43_19230 [Hormoscilla sp. SP5CHS1]|nr:hypothetical protein [Hormoscilla sp. SP5CHS1]
MLVEKTLRETFSRSFKKKRVQNYWSDRRSWGEIFRNTFDLRWTQHVLDPILGCLKMTKHSIKVHRVEKDLVYLTTLSINKHNQLFISLPVSPVSVGTMVVAYSAQIADRISAKAFVLWIGTESDSKIDSLRTAKAFNFIDPWQSRINFKEKIVGGPVDKINEPLSGNKLKAIGVITLVEGVELLQRFHNCSLVVLDDPSGKTYPRNSSYGEEAFALARVCREKNIPLVGIVPPWVMKDIEYNKIGAQNTENVLLWPIDFFTLRSYPDDGHIFDKNRNRHHPIEESFLRLEKKRKCLHEAQVTIRTFSCQVKIAELFQSSSELLLELAGQPQCQTVWEAGWEIWRDLAAPVLPFELLWERLLSRELARLENAAGDSPQAMRLQEMLQTLARMLVTLKENPFLDVIARTEPETVVAIENAERAQALEEFLMASRSPELMPQILPIGQIKDLGGEKLIVLGQPKAFHRDLLQRSFFHKVEVLLWSALADNAEQRWENLEVDARSWHRKTWLELTGKDQIIRYGYSEQPTSVQVVSTANSTEDKTLNISSIEESFNSLTGLHADTEGINWILKDLEYHYLVELEQGQKIRVVRDSEFLLLWRRQTRVVAAPDLRIGPKVVLCEGMNRDWLFAQKVGLLEDTKENFLYRAQLDSWRSSVRQEVERSGLSRVCQKLLWDTGVSVEQETVRSKWMEGQDLLGVPREKAHFFWFIPAVAHEGLEDFWEKADELRMKRAELGDTICDCAKDGWKDRKHDEIVFRYRRVWITVGELRDRMRLLKVQSEPQLIPEKPAFPFNRLFKG